MPDLAGGARVLPTGPLSLPQCGALESNIRQLAASSPPRDYRQLDAVPESPPRGGPRKIPTIEEFSGEAPSAIPTGR